MANKHRTINITVSDNRVERNPRSARPIDERTQLGRVRARGERNPRSVLAVGERSSTFLAKLRPRTCIDEAWISASRRSIQTRGGTAGQPLAAPGTSEVDKLLAQRYGQVRLVPSRISSLRSPYDLRYSTSCQSATAARRRTSSSGVDPRFRRTIRVADGSEGKAETNPAPAAVNVGERAPTLEGPEKRCSGLAREEPVCPQRPSVSNVAVQATSRAGNNASAQSSSVNVAGQTQQWPSKVRASSARTETAESGRIVNLKRSSSDTCLRAHNCCKGSEGRQPEVSSPQEKVLSPRCDQCRSREGDDKYRPEPRSAEPDQLREPTEPDHKRRTDASAQYCKYCCGEGDGWNAGVFSSADPDQSKGATESGDCTRIRRTHALLPTTTVLTRRIKREGYAHQAIIATVRTLLMVLILLSLAWFLFIGMDVFRDWWSPRNTGWVDTCKWFVIGLLRRITILEKCKCS